VTESFQIGEINVAVTRKRVKHSHLTVHPPAGRVTLVVPAATRPEVARAFAISKLGWMRDQRAKLVAQARETHRQYVERETHYLWGRRYLMTVREKDEKPSVTVGHQRITLTVRPGSSAARRSEVMTEWQRQQLRAAVEPLIKKWESKLGVRAKKVFVQRMRTLWGACNPRVGNIRLNTELAKKPKDLVDYVVLHELAHLLEAKHGPAFTAILDRHFPAWREARAELNELPLGAEEWRE
jgi:predicted metal-dependent hydrolase